MFLEHKLIDPKMVDDLMGERIIAFWEKTVSLVLEWRKSSPKNGEHIEYLYNLMKQRQQPTATT